MVPLTRLPWRHPWQLRTAALLLGLLVALGVRWLAPAVLVGVEESAGDLAWRVGASTQAERRVVVVDIDEASVTAVGAWPWPRSTMADLAGRIAKAGAAVQVFDIGFSDAKEGDDRLSAALGLGPVVLGQLFSLDPAVTPSAGEVAGALGQEGCPPFADPAYGAYGTAATLLGARPSVGHMTPRIEGDGVVRRLPALICRNGQAFPSLSLAAIWRLVQPEAGAASGVAPDWQWHLSTDAGAEGGWLLPPAWLTSASNPGLRVPLDRRGDIRVPYRVSRTGITSVSAARVLRGDADLSILKGAVVVVGATAFGAGDVVATPQAAVAAGLEVHVQTIAGLLDRRIPYVPRSAAVLESLCMVVGAALLLLASLAGPGAAGQTVRRLPLAGLAGAVVSWWGASWLLVQADVWVPWATAALFMVVSSAALAASEHLLALRQRERLSAHLTAYLPQPVAQRLMGLDPTGTVEVEQRDVSVLVADIRNFSAYAAHRPAAEAVALLHAFSSMAVDVVERHGGVVERVAGDSIMAVWNAFSTCQSHSQQAMDAACELIQVTRSLLTHRPHEDDGVLVQPLALGIGVETGQAIVGSFGPARRRAHAALGEPVSIASRLQQMTTDLSVPILAGPRLAAQLQPGSTESLGEYLLEGLGRHYQLFVPTAWPDLTPVDSGWAKEASGADRSAASETASWGRWSLSALATAGPQPAPSARESLHQRDA